MITPVSVFLFDMERNEALRVRVSVRYGGKRVESGGGSNSCGRNGHGGSRSSMRSSERRRAATGPAAADAVIGAFLARLACRADEWGRQQQQQKQQQ